MLKLLSRLLWGVDPKDPYMDTLREIHAQKKAPAPQPRKGRRFWLLAHKRAPRPR